MYQLVSAVATSEKFDGRFHPVDITEMPLNQVFDTYTRVLATLTHTVTNETSVLDLHDLPEITRNYVVTLPTFLITNGNATLPTQANLHIDFKTVKFRDVWLMGHDVRPVNRNYHVDSDLMHEDKPDALITKADLDYHYAHRNIVYTVDGMCHMNDAGADGIVIYDGARTADKSNDGQIGAICFAEIGEIEKYPITKDMVSTRSPVGDYRTYMYINTPKHLDGYVPILSIGGFFMALNDCYTVVSQDCIRINWHKVPLIERFLTMYKRINLPKVMIDVINEFGDIEHGKLYSDEVLEAWLTLPQSFLIMVKTNELNAARIVASDSGLFGLFYSYDDNDYPLMNKNGCVMEYRAYNEHGIRAINVSSNRRPEYMHETYPCVEWELIPTMVNPTLPSDQSTGYWLVLSKNVEVQNA